MQCHFRHVRSNKRNSEHAILNTCRDLGVTHIDTANVYGVGKSETAIGSYLKSNPNALSEFTIATKASITSDADGNRIFDNSAEHLETELDKSLQRLGVECVDLFYAHRLDHSLLQRKQWQTLVVS